jgi:hypothetical protein
VFDWKAVIWGPRYGQIRELPLHRGDSTGAASAINDQGQIVGGSGRQCGPRRSRPSRTPCSGKVLR